MHTMYDARAKSQYRNFTLPTFHGDGVVNKGHNMQAVSTLFKKISREIIYYLNYRSS